MKYVLSRITLMLVLAVPGSVLLTPSAAAEEWPTHSVRLVVKYSAGGGTDLLLRTLAKGMEKELGQSISVTNMTGGVGSIAGQYVFDQPADGYTWLGFGNFLKHFRAMGLVDIAAWRDFDTFLVGNSLASCSVDVDSPITSFKDFVEKAKAKPGKLKVATDGKGGLWHEVVSMMGDRLGFEVNFVTYDGGAPATLAALQGEVDVVCSGLHEHIEFIKAGKLRNLTHFDDADIEVAGVGTLRSIGNIFPEFKALLPFGSMYGIGLKRGTPKPILMKVKAAIMAGLADPDFSEMLEKRFFKKALLYGNEADLKAAQLEVITANLFSDIGIAKSSPKELGLPPTGEFDSWWPPTEYQPSVVE